MGNPSRHAFERHFKAPRSKVWAGIADTARYNESLGLPKHEIREQQQADPKLLALQQKLPQSYIYKSLDQDIEDIIC
ncbi:MAG: hypothetical protein P8N43_08370, partial [Alphaproteobacteria bacterium]|nr:hypothetical protein [Alphaproteobacteria bacterium]